MWLQNPRKAGFHALGKVRIYDRTGASFYGTEKGTDFNLPAGLFDIEGKYEPLPFPVPFEMTTYPIERDDRPFNRINVTVCKNPHKATVMFRDLCANIFIDHSIAAMPLFCQAYVIGHECAHSKFYGDNPQDLECKCDAHGEQRMIDLGYNPAQLRCANKKLLKSGWRKEQCENRMLKHFRK